MGLILFVGLFAVSAIAVLLARKKDNAALFLPALGALLVFMAIHAFTEVVFSVYCYLPLAYGVFALVNLACNDVFKWPHSDKKRGNKERLGVIAGFSAILVVFGVLLSCNITAKRTIERHATMDNLQAAARIDRYEWADHALSYVVSSQNLDITTSMRIQAEEYAALLAEVDSNFIPPYLAEYYFNNGREALAIDMLKKYVSYVAIPSVITYLIDSNTNFDVPYYSLPWEYKADESSETINMRLASGYKYEEWAPTVSEVYNVWVYLAPF